MPTLWKNGDQKSLEKAASKYLSLHTKLPIVHISTVYLPTFYFIIMLSITQTMGFYYDISTYACNIFWSCSHHIIFTLWLCLLHIVFKICQLYQILYVYTYVHTEARGKHWMFMVTLHLTFWDRISPWIWNSLISLDWLALGSSCLYSRFAEVYTSILVFCLSVFMF